jgi:pilus assembly protein CpaC
MSKTQLYALLIVTLLSARVSMAEEIAAAAPPTPAPMTAATEPDPLDAAVAETPAVQSQGGEIMIELNKGRMIKLEQAIASVAISDPATADVQVVSPRMLFVRGKKVGETTIYAVDAADNMVFSAILQVTHNISKLQEAVKRASPDSDVSFHSVEGGLVMEGFTPSSADSEKVRNVASAFLGEKDKIVDLLKTAGSDQVTLQVKIVEMQRNDAKRFGINMQNMFGTNGIQLQVLQGPDIEIDTSRNLQDPLVEVDHAGIFDRGLDRGGNATGTQILSRFNHGRMNNLIDAMETQGLISVLAEPSLTTTSGKTASFLAGGEFPIAVNSGNNTITVTYKPFGVGLNFTPVVMNKDRISIDVAPEVSTIDLSNSVSSGSGISNPIILTRKASSTIELGSGQTFALAGLLKSDRNMSVDKMPGLGEVPILGALFRSQAFQNNQTELVILVTPYIVRPVSAKKMQTPLDGYVPPNDLQRLLLGNLYQQEPLQSDAPQTMPTLNGSGGFILGE